jgi:hypothetical protein
LHRASTASDSESLSQRAPGLPESCMRPDAAVDHGCRLASAGAGTIVL